MQNVIAYVGAVVSTIGAVLAWYFSYQMKRFELAQLKASTVLEKRFTCYPAVWTLCQTFHAKVVAKAVTKGDVVAFASDLMQLYQRNGLYYSLELQKAILTVIKDGSSVDLADALM